MHSSPDSGSVKVKQREEKSIKKENINNKIYSVETEKIYYDQSNNKQKTKDKDSDNSLQIIIKTI